MKLVKIGGKSVPASASLTMFCTPRQHSTPFGEGFQIVALPQIADSSAFQAQTATGKLNAVTTPTTPSGCHCSYIR